LLAAEIWPRMIVVSPQGRCMTELYFRKPTTAHEWRLRAERLRQHIDRLSIDELFRGGPIGETSNDGVGSHGHRYDPNQPRVPAGHPDGGQWTGKGGHASGPTSILNAVQSAETVISDLGGDLVPGAQYASRRTRHGPIFIHGRPVEISLGQANRLAAAEAQAREAINLVREHDPNWRPRPSAYGTVEGLIAAHRADAQQARERFGELQYNGIIPGPYFREGIPARGPDRSFRPGERDWMNELFARHGCHTCGTRDPGTPRGNAVLDHQPPTRYDPLRKRQLLLPQCLACSRRQGLWIIQNGAQQ
jgi:hypothetical protein